MRALSTLVMLSALALGAATGCAAPFDEEAASAEADLSARERADIINALRAKVKPELGNQDILFNFSRGSFRTANDYAFVMGQIELRGGAEPSVEGTIYAEDAEMGIWDGFHVEALLEKKDGAWTVLEHGVGSTDVWFDGIEERYPGAPTSIFPWLDGEGMQEVAPSERTAIMAGLRAELKPDLADQDIVFNVSRGHYATANGWAWLQGMIELRGGGEPTTVGTIYEGDAEVGLFDGWRFEALLKKDGDTWKVLAHGIGSTDVWYSGIAEGYPEAPASIFPPEALATP